MIRTLAGLGLLLGSAAAHPPPAPAPATCGCACPCACGPRGGHGHGHGGHVHGHGGHAPHTAAHAPAAAPAPKAPAERIASLEASIGLATNYLGLVDGADGLRAEQFDTGPLYALTPALEWRYGSILYLGFEALLASVADVTSAGGRRSVIAPAIRLRLSFDLFNDVQADALFAGGIARWAGEGDSNLYGFTRRAAFGGAYQVKDGLWAFLWLGNQVVEAGPGGKGPLSTEYSAAQPVGASGFMLTAGVRTGL